MTLRRLCLPALLSLALLGCSTLTQTSKTVTPATVEHDVAIGKRAVRTALQVSPKTLAKADEITATVVQTLKGFIASGQLPDQDQLQALLLSKIPAADRSAAQGILAIVLSRWQTFVASAKGHNPQGLAYAEAIVAGLES
jgi:hypothetical protein